MRARNVAITVAIAAGVALGGGAIYANAEHDTTGDVPSADHRPAATADRFERTYGTFAALQTSDLRPTARVLELIRVLNRRLDVDPDRARGVKTARGETAWIIPGRSDLCFGAPNGDGVGYACHRHDEPFDDTLLFSAAARTDGRVDATFLVPDTVTALEVEGRTVPPTNNTVTVTFRDGAKVTRIDHDGTRRVLKGTSPS